MNQRILSPQLLKLVQAAGPGYSQANPEWVKKFAELIVKECAEVLVTWNRENGAEEGLDKEGLISLWSPHFGVEE